MAMLYAVADFGLVRAGLPRSQTDDVLFHSLPSRAGSMASLACVEMNGVSSSD
jgi:hypothetical protein